MVLFKILVLGLLDWQVLRSLILQTKISEVCYGTFCLVAVNLYLLENDTGFVWKILDNQPTKLDSTSWD